MSVKNIDFLFQFPIYKQKEKKNNKMYRKI